MNSDNLAQAQSDQTFQVWVQNLLRNSPEQLAGKFAARHCLGTPVLASRLPNGAFNVCYRVTYDNGHRVVVRFTALGRNIDRREKVEDEVAVMNYVAQHTTIPVPKILGHGKCAVGPYIVMSYIEGNMLSGYLRDSSQETATLKPSIATSVLRRAYSSVTEILLELSKPEFPYIGANRQGESGGWTVPKRPYTFNMNRIAQFSNIPLSVFKQHRFSNAADYFEELAQQHFYHLEHQRNDAVSDEADCRKKYVARCLFRRISRDISTEHCRGPFRLYCDDLCPGNVLVDASKLVVARVVDWEFTYAAPVNFTYAAPWWLLLERPEDWELDLNQSLVRYMPRLRTFLEVLQDCEASKIRDGSLLESQRLSPAMESSLETGLFWMCLASRYGTLFDEIYWEFIDTKFFGRFTTLEDRIGLPSAEERAQMDAFIEKKIDQASERNLLSHYTFNELVDI